MPRVATVFVAPKEATCPLKPLLLTPANTMHRFVSEPVQPGLLLLLLLLVQHAQQANSCWGPKKQLAALYRGVFAAPKWAMRAAPQ